MDSSRDGKRKKDKHSDDDEKRKEKKSKRPRSRSNSPDKPRDRDSRRKRRHSKSQSPTTAVKQEKSSTSEKEPHGRKEAPERRAKETDMLNTRTGGAYIPPARLRMMQAQITDKSSIAYQRLAWEALKKSIHGHINKINVGNIGIIIKELLKENIVRGRGLLCRSVIQAQAASPTFTNVYAALVAAVNSRFPNIGELLLKRLVIQFKRGFKRNDKPTCISSVSFVAHLINQRVAHEILALELLTLLVESPTDDSVEVAIAFLKECGQKLTEVSSKGVNAIFEMLRNILHEGQLDKRVQYMIEVMFQVWKDGFKDHPALIEELELVPEEEQFTHLLMLDDATDPQDILNVFKFDDKYEENEQKYKTLSKEILGSDAESGDEEDGSGESGSDESDEEEQAQKPVTIIDNTETNLVALRRTIYLTINSSLDFEECAHKLMKMQLKPGQEIELCHMFLDCCAEQRTYEKFYGLLAQRFCNINRIYIGPFEEIFKDSYSTAHRLDTNRLRNVSKFFAHLLFTDSISWEVMECVRLNEEDTTSSSRIYIKILFQELAEYMGLKKLNDRLKDPTLQEAFAGVFPRDNPKNTRFSINFFTSIGLGGLTDELREHLKQMPKNVPPPVTEIQLDSDSSSDSSSSSSSDSSSGESSSSDSEGDESKKKKKKDKSASKNFRNTEKPAETPEEGPVKDTERWGHDGFYDTYGKDARRMESRPDRPRDADNFARPRDIRRTDDRDRSDQRNGDDWRNRRNERYQQNNEEFKRSDRNDTDKSRRRDDEEIRSKRTDDRTDRDEETRRYERRHTREDGDRRRDDLEKENSRSSRNDPRSNRDSDRPSRDDSRQSRDDSGLSRDDSRSNQADARSNRDDSRSYRDNSRSNRDDYRSSRDDSRSNRDNSRSIRDDYKSNRDESKSNRDDYRSNRDDSRTNRDESRPNRDDSRSSRDDSRAEVPKSKDYSKSKNRNEEKENGEDRRRDTEDYRIGTKSRDDVRHNKEDTEHRTTQREAQKKLDEDKIKERGGSSEEDDDEATEKKQRRNKKDKKKRKKKSSEKESTEKDKRKNKYSSDEGSSQHKDSRKKKKKKDKSEKTSSRYWDVFDIKSSKVVSKEVRKAEKVRERRERS